MSHKIYSLKSDKLSIHRINQKKSRINFTTILLDQCKWIGYSIIQKKARHKLVLNFADKVSL